jgi:hypothetical protein
MIRIAVVLVLGAATAALGGCRKAPPPPIVEVEGIVRLDGKPLNKVHVRFLPSIIHGEKYIASGVTDESGRFRLTCKGQPGACVGENLVLISEAEIPEQLRGRNARDAQVKYFESLGGRPLPQQFGNLCETTLKVEVTAEQKEYPFDLVR